MKNVTRILVPCLCLTAGPLVAQEDLLAHPERWTVTSGSAFVVEDGTPVLRLIGGATLRDVDFQDGSVAFEVRLTSRAGFVGVQFRTGERDAEHVYFRPHKSGEWDAIQYQPIMNGSTTWQIHRGEGYTAPAAFPHGKWLAVRLDVRGDHADVFLGDQMEPAIRVHLERGVTSGGIALTSGFRESAPAGEVPASFRHFVIRRSAPSGQAERQPMVMPGPDRFLREWSVSAPVAITELPVTEIPGTAGTTTRVVAEPRGVVNLNRYFSRLAGAEQTAVSASTVLRAERAMRVPMALDFSDDVSVFLNGELLFSGTNGWQSRYPYYLGALHPDTLTSQVWLPLRGGENILSLVVSEQAFGWGFAATLSDRTGLRVQGR